MQTAPVIQRKPIAQSSLTKVFDVPDSFLYRVEVTNPTGQMDVFDHARAYTDSLAVLPNGYVEMVIVGKGNAKPVTIPYPYHYLLENGVLFAVKMFEVRMGSGGGQLVFGLNYDLFCLSWGLCVIAHVFKGQRVVFYASRAEWDRGSLGCINREVQMFLSIPEERNFDIDLYALQADPAVRKWVTDAKAVMARKKRMAWSQS